MLEILNEGEKEVAMMLMQGQNANGIMNWLGIDYKEYIKIKKNILKELKIRRITQLLPLAVEEKWLQEI